MFRELLLALVLGIIVYYVVQYLNNLRIYFGKLWKIQHVKQPPFFGNLFDIITIDDASLFALIRSWCQKYGPIYCASVFYFSTVQICGAEEFELVSSSMKHIQKAHVYGYLHKWLGTGLLTSSGSQWQVRRKILTPAFHFSILQDFVKVFNKETDKLIEIIKKKVGEPINLVPMISQFTLDVICETAMGSELDLMNDSDNRYVKSIHQLGAIIKYRFFRPWLIFDFIFHYLDKFGRLQLKLLDITNGFTKKVIKKREENFEKFVEPTDDNDYNYSKRKKLAMLDLMLNAKLTNGIIDDEGITDEVNTFMFEGHDTTSMSICFILMLLANHRSIQDRVYEEVMQNLKDKNQKHFNLQELNELKYMECVIKEGLRLYPSVPFIGRILEEDVVTKDRHVLPKDCQVFVHIYDIHRNPKHWPDPNKFDPDRFLPENYVNRHPFAYVPFSAGPRNCIGQKFAMLEIKEVLSGILMNYILEPVDRPETLVLVQDVVLRPQHSSLRLKFIDRT